MYYVLLCPLPLVSFNFYSLKKMLSDEETGKEKICTFVLKLVWVIGGESLKVIVLG